MDTEQDQPEPPSSTRLFRGHTLAEAGESWWAPKWLLVGFRMLSLVALVAIIVLTVLTGISAFGSYTWLLFVSVDFWGPVLHFSGLLLLVVCSFRGRSGSSSSGAGSKLANVAVPVYQIGSTLSVISGVTGIILALVLGAARTGWLSLVVHCIWVLILLFDSLVLGAMVRFRYMYVWIPTLLFTITMTIAFVVAGSFSPEIFGILVGLALAALVAGLLLTALTRAVPKCCCAGRTLPDAPSEQQSETGNV